MGSTFSALHIVRRSSGGPASEAIVEAGYARLGWAPHPGDPDAGNPLRRVAVLPNPQGGATLLDDGCARFDDGTLRALAVELSRTPNVAVLVAAVEDSDIFTLLLYADGHQIDALSGPDEEALGPELTQASLGTRPALWTSACGPGSGPFPSAPLPTTSFAEEVMEAWLTAAGIPPEHASLQFSDVPYAMIRSYVAAPSAAPVDGPAPALETYFDPDDCPHLRLYPGPWPLAPGEATSLKWIVLCSAGGFDGLDLRLDFSEVTGDIHLSSVRAVAYPFHNGQITSPNPVAQAEQTIGRDLSDGPISITLGPFPMPALDPAARRRIAILLTPIVTPGPGSAARIGLSLGTCAPETAPLPLPPARLVAAAPGWVPRGAHGPDSERTPSLTEAEAVRVLATPSVLSGISILPGASDAARAEMQAAAERFVVALPGCADGSLTLRTLKHMTPSGSIAKKQIDMAPGALPPDKLWRRAFLAKSDMQTVAITLRPPGAALPMAGCSLQMALRPDPEEPGAEDTDPAPHLSFWMIDHPEAHAALGLDHTGFAALFADWLAHAQPLQAYLARAAWIPEFDLYTDYAHTPYEELTGVDWFRTGLNGTMMRRSWCAARLRFLSAMMWVSDEVAGDRVDLTALSAVADVERMGDLNRIVLKPQARMEDLEAVLAPILPGAVG